MTGPRWWQTGVLYEIYPRSFMDGDGDGIGDLAGITARLDHLAALGVDGIWICPFYRSPMVDCGYDITDHTDVDPVFGTLADFDVLLAEAHTRGIRVLVDFVPNHTSDQHPWFAAARAGRDSAKRDWYIWADPAHGGGPPNNWRSVFGGSAWTLDDASGQYYYHAYLAEQPDLNWRNPEVRKAQYDVMRFWLARGVDGFRVDACRQIVKDDQLRDNPPNPAYHDGLPPYDGLIPEFTTDRPELLEITTQLRSVVDAERPDGDALLLGELYLPLDRLMRYYGAGDALHLPSNMHLISVEYAAAEIAALIRDYERLLPDHAWPTWVLGNHDRSRVASRVGRRQARVAAMLLLTLRGTPVLYYGDEIGMTDAELPDHLLFDAYERNVPGIGAGRDPERTPMQWSADPHGGFCPPDVVPWLPSSADAESISVAAQRHDPHSMLSLHERLIALRSNEPALSRGACCGVRADGEVLIFERAHERRRFVIVLNLGSAEAQVALDGATGCIALDTALERVGEPVGSVVVLRADEGLVIDCS